VVFGTQAVLNEDFYTIMRATLFMQQSNMSNAPISLIADMQ
jgi:hypothetical protein